MPVSPIRTFLLPVLALTAIVLVACDSDDDEIRVGSDEDYVRDACEAQSEFFGGALAALFTTGEGASEEEQLEALEGPVSDMRDAMKDARPPADAVDYHRTLLMALDDILDAIDSGDLDALNRLDDVDADADLPAATRDRLNAIAEETEECGGLGNPFAEG